VRNLILITGRFFVEEDNARHASTPHQKITLR
jgi:hypothetical protein